MILDTNALSAFVYGDAGAGAVLRTQTRAAVPVIVLGEFRYGIAQSRHRSSYEAWLGSNLIHFDILPVTEETAIAHASLRVALKRSGRPIPANDAWIAALALQHGLPVLQPRTSISTWCRASNAGAGDQAGACPGIGPWSHTGGSRWTAPGTALKSARPEPRRPSPSGRPGGRSLTFAAAAILIVIALQAVERASCRSE